MSMDVPPLRVFLDTQKKTNVAVFKLTVNILICKSYTLTPPSHILTQSDLNNYTRVIRN